MAEKIYYTLINFFSNLGTTIIPYSRRFLRFLALPYAYFYMMDWDECKASRIKVAFDFLYIFFILKYFPDNYSLCRFWEKDRSEWKYYYGSIYNPYNRARLRKKVQLDEYRILFDDKEVCYQLCQSANLPLPRQFAVIDDTGDIHKLLKDLHQETGLDKFIIKPVTGKGGEDIFLVLFTENGIHVKQNVKKENKTLSMSFKEFNIKRRSVVQEFVNQHESLKRLSQYSLNTIRIATLLTKEKTVIFLGGLIRIGHDKSIVDNSSSGGVAVGIDIESGTLKEIGYDFKSKTYRVHPTSGFIFAGFQIPFWKEILEIAKKTQLIFPYYKLLGSDIALSKEGPVIIEINASYDNVGLEQKSGPVLARPEVLNAFKEYDLLSRRL